MQLFSKRYPSFNFSRVPVGTEEKEKFLSGSLRMRLVHQIKYIVTSKECYLEPFLVTIDKSDSSLHLCEESIKNLTISELGYDLTNIFNCFIMTYEQENYTDFYLFDLIEILIIFSTESKRPETVKRFQDTLRDESSDFMINEYMVIYKKEIGLRAVLPLIKDSTLRSKIEEYYSNLRVRGGYEATSRITADILQYLFSSPKQQKKTKKYSEVLCKKIAMKWTTKVNIENLATLIGNTVTNAKDLNNQISNIRHTDKFTIPVDNQTFYKMVTAINFSIIELTIQSFPEDYVINKSATDLKTEYMLKYNLTDQKEHIVDTTPSDNIPF